jgi:hypothetical protein
VVAKIAHELTVHAELEETIVYPSVRQAALGDLIEEAEQEHQKVKDLVAQLEAADRASCEVDDILADLKANVSHHVGEEVSETFPEFRQAVDQSSLEALGQLVEAPRRQPAAERLGDAQPATGSGPSGRHSRLRIPRHIKLANDGPGSTWQIVQGPAMLERPWPVPGHRGHAQHVATH